MPSMKRWQEEVRRGVERDRLRLHIAALEFDLLGPADWSAETRRVAQEIDEECSRAGCNLPCDGAY